MSTLAKKIVLRSSDDQVFEVEKAVALQSQTIAHMIEDDCVQDGVPLANVAGAILSKVIEYCNKHVVVVVPGGDGDGDGDSSSSSSEEELKKWDADFISQMDQPTLFSLIMAANYLDIRSLLDLTTQTVAESIKDKTVEKVRSIFNIPKDFTDEEEAKLREENQWAFE